MTIIKWEARSRRARAFAAVGVTMALVLGACAIGPGDSGGGSPGATDGGEPVGGGEPSGVLNFTNWPLYIDDDGEGNRPTIDQFEEETGIDVTYSEAIQDNSSFFGTIQPQLEAGQDPGHDIIVVTDWMIGNMIELGYLEQIDVDRDIPNFMANAADKYKDRSYDPGNLYSVPWQSGITGIGYNPALVDEEITSLAQLFDPEFIQKYCGQIGMFSEMRDVISLALLYNGVIPEEATIEDVEAAQEVLLEQAECVRGYYGNEYADDFANGSLAITMAWSGDVFQLQLDNPDLQFVVPDEGAILWTDNMAIPKGAEHPDDALAMMDYVYRPEVAAQIAEWVNYITAVPGAQELVTQHADEAEAEGDTETADYLRTVAESPLVFPTDDMLSRLYSYKVLDEDEERQWAELFQEVTQG
ncbi:MAG: spermidine/putrescine ABC transporter substrate-binding protein [Candidatus Limnocylindria bacterium]